MKTMVKWLIGCSLLLSNQLYAGNFAKTHAATLEQIDMIIERDSLIAQECNKAIDILGGQALDATIAKALFEKADRDCSRTITGLYLLSTSEIDFNNYINTDPEKIRKVNEMLKAANNFVNIINAVGEKLFPNAVRLKQNIKKDQTPSVENDLKLKT